MSKFIKPGSVNKEPGRYVEVGSSGEHLNNPRVIEMGSGDRFPPTSKSGNGWKKK